MRPHFLLNLDPIELLSSDGKLLHREDLPAWADLSLQRAPLVVVRRGRAKSGLVPVGIRGFKRSERYAAFVSPAVSSDCIRPFDLLTEQTIHAISLKNPNTVFSLLVELTEKWQWVDIPWGPGGSVGFELASNYPTTSQSSDLDVVVYADQPLSDAYLRRMWTRLPETEIKIDVLIETPFGGFSLEEYVYCSPGNILLKTDDGPQVCAIPWHIEQSGAYTACP